jgi:large subunit ribosomal protein L25
MKFTAYERTQQGTGASRRLRNAAKVPGIVYGAGTPAMIELDHNALYFALKKEAFHSSILDMELAGKTQKVLLRDFQMHAYKPQVLHVDFQRVDEATRLRKKVPLHFSGEENSPAVKTDKCLVSHVATELEIECLASQLPEFVSIDLSGLTKNQSLHASDLKLPEGIKAVKHGTLNPVIVAVTTPKAEAEEPAATAPVVAAPEKGKAAKPKKDEKQNKK